MVATLISYEKIWPAVTVQVANRNCRCLLPAGAVSLHWLEGAVIANCNGNAGVLLGNGDGSFQTALNFASDGLDPFSLVVDDISIRLSTLRPFNLPPPLLLFQAQGHRPVLSRLSLGPQPSQLSR